MAAVKFIILFSVFAIALSFAASENHFDDLNFDKPPLQIGQIVVRKTRSPQEANDVGDGNDRRGIGANFKYTYAVDRNFGIYAGPLRTFKYSGNGGYVDPKPTK